MCWNTLLFQPDRPIKCLKIQIASNSSLERFFILSIRACIILPDSDSFSLLDDIVSLRHIQYIQTYYYFYLPSSYWFITQISTKSIKEIHTPNPLLIDICSRFFQRQDLLVLILLLAVVLVVLNCSFSFKLPFVLKNISTAETINNKIQISNGLNSSPFIFP